MSRTEVVRVDPQQPDPDDIARAAGCLRHGGLVAFPTETVYGLGVHAFDRDAVQRLFEAKGRPANDPLIVHISSFDQLPSLVSEVPDIARALAARFWPGPLTLVMRRNSAVPREITAGLDTVAVRVPSHPVARALLGAVGLPIAAPSANLFSRPSPTRAAHVVNDLNGRIDMILDGGPTQVGVESTVVDITADAPLLLRPGAISVEVLRSVIPLLRLRDAPALPTRADEPMASPGLLSKHYAPRAPLTLYHGNPAALGAALIEGARRALSQGLRVGVLGTTEDTSALRAMPLVFAELGSAFDDQQVAARLYAALRELDDQHVDVILARDIASRDGLGRAIGDRLQRAAAETVRIE